MAPANTPTGDVAKASKVNDSAIAAMGTSTVERRRCLNSWAKANETTRAVSVVEDEAKPAMTESPIPASWMKMAIFRRYTMPIVIDTNMRRMPAHARAPIFFCCGESSLALRENSRSFSGGTLGRQHQLHDENEDEEDVHEERYMPSDDRERAR